MNPPIRFHWSLSQAGNAFRRSQKNKPGMISTEAQLALCKKAEQYNIDSVLMAVGYTRPDPMLLTVLLGQKTEKINFLVAVRSGLISPTFFVQQVNTVSHLIGGRIYVNVVNGYSPKELKYYGDFLNYEQRYERTEEFVEICRLFWEKNKVDYNGKYYQIEKGQINTSFNAKYGNRPKIYIGGNSAHAANMTAKMGDCLWRFPDTPEKLIPLIAPVLKNKKEAGLLVALIARPTQKEALKAAGNLVAHFGEEAESVINEFTKTIDSQGFKAVYNLGKSENSKWITPYLWTGAVPYLGAPAIALVGSYENIAEAIMNYKKIGITQYLFSGWPDMEEMVHFGEGVLPLVRELEKKRNIFDLE